MKGKRLFLAALLAMCVAAMGLMFGCSGGSEEEAANQGEAPQAATATVTDDAGREVVIPAPEAMEKIYYTNHVGQIYCMTLVPDLCAGVTMDFTEQELAYLPERFASLENLGTSYSGKELSPEALMAEGIQVIFSISSFDLTDKDITDAEDLQAQTGIPVVLLEGSLDKTAECYVKLGKMLGVEAQAQELADYCTTTLDQVAAAVATIPEDERVSLYYAEGPEGLQTEPTSSSHALILEMSGAKNVAVDMEVEGGKGKSLVSMEQVLAWDPQVIIAWDEQRYEGGADELIRTSENWAPVKAVQDGRVYTMPQAPFSWIDRPGAVNRIIGLQWLTNLLYPEAYDVDMVQVTQEFYSLFYHHELTEQEAKDLLGNSYQG